MESRMYVGNLPYSATEDELKQLFSQAGEVVSVSLIKDRDTGRSKGFAFVSMKSQADADKAISMFNGYRMNDRQLTVNMARPREERGSGGPGGGRGGFGGQNRGGDRDRQGDRGGGRRY